MQRSGGCLCGRIRYTVAGEPGLVTYCHCTRCRRASGSAAVAWATFERAALTILSGTASSYHSSSHGQRGFCAACGTHMFFCSASRAHQIDVTVGSLDDPAVVQPTCHIFSASMVPWLVDLASLPRHTGDCCDELVELVVRPLM